MNKSAILDKLVDWTAEKVVAPKMNFGSKLTTPALFDPEKARATNKLLATELLKYIGRVGGTSAIVGGGLSGLAGLTATPNIDPKTGKRRSRVNKMLGSAAIGSILAGLGGAGYAAYKGNKDLKDYYPNITNELVKDITNQPVDKNDIAVNAARGYGTANALTGTAALPVVGTGYLLRGLAKVPALRALAPTGASMTGGGWGVMNAAANPKSPAFLPLMLAANSWVNEGGALDQLRNSEGRDAQTPYLQGGREAAIANAALFGLPGYLGERTSNLHPGMRIKNELARLRGHMKQGSVTPILFKRRRVKPNRDGDYPKTSQTAGFVATAPAGDSVQPSVLGNKGN